MKFIRYFIIVILQYLALVATAQNSTIINDFTMLSEAPKREVRAVWLTTIGGLDWPSKYAQTNAGIMQQQDEFIGILNRLQQAGINTVILQTRVRATTIYPSAIEPWDGCMSGTPGKSPGYDPLQFAIEECHRRGIELHAWVVCIPIGKWSGKGCQTLRKRMPKLVKKIGDHGFMDVENPQTGQYIANICAEIASNYDVDGIHLDYIRYPEEWNIKVKKDAGRRNVTSIVRQISQRVRQLKPWVKLSCSPIGKRDDLTQHSSKGWNAYSRVCQDATGWLRDGYMDQLYPMMYFKDNNFYPFAIDWKEHNYGKTIVPGLGIYFLSPKEKNWNLDDITTELEVIRQQGMGQCYFRSRFLLDNVKGIYDYAVRHNTYPALPPAATWLSSKHPDAPEWIYIDKPTGTLSWAEGHDNSNAPYLLYNVYASRKWPVDTEDARNLVAARLTERCLCVDNIDRYYFAVTAIDRYGNESEAIQMTQPLPLPPSDNHGNLIVKDRILKHLKLTKKQP